MLVQVGEEDNIEEEIEGTVDTLPAQAKTKSEPLEAATFKQSMDVETRNKAKN